MTIEFQLDEKDYLTNFLFFASKDKSIKQKRIRSFFIILIICLVFFFLYSPDLGQSKFYLIGFYLLILISFPFYSKWQYKRNYQKLIKNKFQNKLNQNLTLDIDVQKIFMNDEDQTEVKLMTNQLYQIHEIAHHFLFKIKSGESIVVPKNAIKNISEFESLLKKIAKINQIDFTKELNWKW